MQELIKHLIILLLEKIVEFITSILALFVSICALVATIIQLYIQREHNERSLKALGQIDLKDKLNLMYVRVVNKGLGPMRIYKLCFQVGTQVYADIEKCLSASPKSYMHVYISQEINKTLSPNDHIEVFEKVFPLEEGKNFDDAAKVIFQQELAKIHLSVFYKDIHENDHVISRDLGWFARHLVSRTSVEGNPEHTG